MSSKEDTAETQYQGCELLLLEIRSQLEALESRSGGDPSHVLAGQLAANINELSRATAALEKRVASESLGELWRTRTRQLAAECQALRTSLYGYMEHDARLERQAEERKALLEGAAAGSGTLSSRQQRLGYLLDENAALNGALTALDSTLMTGDAILGGLDEQKEKMGQLKKKFRGFLQTLGVSRETMDKFEKRTKGDALLVYGGLAGLLLILIILFLVIRK